MNKNSLLELERLFKRIKRKMGHFDYYETNLGIVVYNKVDEGEIIEFSDINYGTYRIVSNDDEILFSYVNDMFRINIRSRGPHINEVAAKYNGGGHRYASGVRTKNKEDIESLEEELDELCKNYVKDNEL